jgi:hypothetical protein
MVLTMAGLGLVIPRAGGSGPPIALEKILASDDFSTGDGVITGRSTNNLLGGTSALVYGVSAGGSNWLITGGSLKRTAVGAAASVAGCAMPQADHGMYLKVLSVTVAAFIIMCRRSALSGGTDSRISLNPDGTITGAITGTWVTGDVIGYRVTGSTIEWVKNDLVIGTSAALNTAAGFAAVSANANCQFDVDNIIYKIPA